MSKIHRHRSHNRQHRSSRRRARFGTVLWIALYLGLIPWAPLLAEPDLAARQLRDTAPEDFFALRLVTPPDELIATQLPLQFLVYNPFHGTPIEGVVLEVEIEASDDGDVDRTSSHRLVSDPHGEAQMLIELPAARSGSLEATLEVTATHRGLTLSLSSFIYPGSYPQVLMSTDRSLYQAGQTVHAARHDRYRGPCRPRLGSRSSLCGHA